MCVIIFNMFESIKKVAGNKEQEVPVNNIDTNLSRSNHELSSLVARILREHPGLEKTIDNAKMTMRILTALVVAGGGSNLFAQELPQKTADDLFFKAKALDIVPTMTVSEISSKLELVKLPFLMGRKTSFSRTINETRTEGQDEGNIKQEYSGSVPSDTGMVGQYVGINAHTLMTTKSTDVLDGGHKTKEENIFEIEVSDNFKENEIKESEITVKMSATGPTKEDAILSAISGLQKYGSTYVQNIYFQEKKSDKKGNEDERISEKYLKGSNQSSLNVFKNLRVDKIEEIEEAGETVYVAYVSAQPAELL